MNAITDIDIVNIKKVKVYIRWYCQAVQEDTIYTVHGDTAEAREYAATGILMGVKRDLICAEPMSSLKISIVTVDGQTHKLDDDGFFQVCKFNDIKGTYPSYMKD